MNSPQPTKLAQAKHQATLDNTDNAFTVETKPFAA